MRSDLNKLLCERERHRSSDSHRYYRRAKKWNARINPDGEDPVVRQEGIARRYGYNGKDFNENLNPLYGVVRKAVGRPYSRFYSELCKVFDKRSVINQHILQHLEQYLETKAVYVDGQGKLRVRLPYWHAVGDLLLKESSVEYYVDPRDGLIKRNKPVSWRTVLRANAARDAAKKAKVYRRLDDGRELRWVNGTWFVDAVVVENNADTAVFDKERGEWVPKDRTYTTRRTASRKLLKQAALI